MNYLDEQLLAAPEQAALFTQLADCWQKKLWFQMAQKLTALKDEKYFLQEQRLLDLHQRFVLPFADNLKQLQFVEFAIAATRQAEDLKTTFELMDTVSKLENVTADPQASALAKLELTLLQVQLGNIESAKVMLEESKKAQDSYPGIMETVVYSKYHLASLSLYKATGEASKYFASAMLFLTYTPLEDIPSEEKTQLAKDVGLAALLGDNIYNFGELLQHPILEVLASTTHAWVADMLQAFNHGDLKAYSASYQANATSNPVLASKEAFLTQKLRVMTLMDVVFTRSSSERVIPFSEVATLCNVPLHEVELLAMKAFSLKVIRGSIDQVQRTLSLTWVQPRVLDTTQTARLRDRLATWGREVSTTATNLEAQAPELLSQAVI
jgi:26S proteasome regulatory subunit N9